MNCWHDWSSKTKFRYEYVVIFPPRPHSFPRTIKRHLAKDFQKQEPGGFSGHLFNPFTRLWEKQASRATTEELEHISSFLFRKALKASWFATETESFSSPTQLRVGRNISKNPSAQRCSDSSTASLMWSRKLPRLSAGGMAVTLPSFQT